MSLSDSIAPPRRRTLQVDAGYWSVSGNRAVLREQFSFVVSPRGYRSQQNVRCSKSKEIFQS